jgi:hypothetical protein
VRFINCETPVTYKKHNPLHVVHVMVKILFGVQTVNFE